MIVKCPYCATNYNVDRRRLTGSGMLKCSRCRHVFPSPAHQRGVGEPYHEGDAQRQTRTRATRRGVRGGRGRQKTANRDASPEQPLQQQPVETRRVWWERPNHIIRCPGKTARDISEFLFSKKTFKGVFEPLLADQASEWSEAIADHRIWKARWVRVRYAYTFAAHLLAQAPLSLAKVIIETWKLI